MAKKLAVYALILVLVLAAGACSSPDAPGLQPEPEETLPDDSAETLDGMLAQVAREVPGFGGLFYGDDGNLNVYMVEAADALDVQAVEAQQVVVREALTAVFGENLLLRSPALRFPESINSQALPVGIKVLPGQYDFLQLAKWRQAADRTLSLAGMVFTDVDEATNRLRIGVESAAAIAAVEQELAKQGVPLEAVIIEETEPVSFANHTLRSFFNSIPGGVQIQLGTSTTVVGTCTLGFNATRGGVRGFITNSHCTRIQGGVENTVFYQPTRNNSVASKWRVGVETRDPLYFTGGVCPAGKRCRFSDSAFARYDAGIPSRLGRIARVTGNGTTGGGAGSLTVNHNNPEYRIIGEVSVPVVGEVLDKIGRTTGHTFGKVSHTCLHVNVNGTNIHLRCQDRVANAGVNPGDSGSPVVRWNSNGDVRLAGILWGQDGSNFWFSAMANIRGAGEMGAITTR